jgi:hypothetical protein
VGDDRVYVAEIKDVKATDWLPEQFRVGSGPSIDADQAEKLRDSSD